LKNAPIEYSSSEPHDYWRPVKTRGRVQQKLSRLGSGEREKKRNQNGRASSSCSMAIFLLECGPLAGLEEFCNLPTLRIGFFACYVEAIRSHPKLVSSDVANGCRTTIVSDEQWINPFLPWIHPRATPAEEGGLPQKIYDCCTTVGETLEFTKKKFFQKKGQNATHTH